jgi:hypothetical protein
VSDRAISEWLTPDVPRSSSGVSHATWTLFDGSKSVVGLRSVDSGREEIICGNQTRTQFLDQWFWRWGGPGFGSSCSSFPVTLVVTAVVDAKVSWLSVVQATNSTIASASVASTNAASSFGVLQPRTVARFVPFCFR